MPALAHVIIPAHDEAAVLGETLRTLLADVPSGTLEVVVVANGCTDDTAAIARIFPGVRVVELDQASKAEALSLASRIVSGLPRVHLDADCPIAGRDVVRLVQALDEPGVLATAPTRHVDVATSSRWVRDYYRFWEQLPGVRDGLYGRGVIALSGAGQSRVEDLPPVLSDDLAISEAFEPQERRIVPEAQVAIRVPRTRRDLVRRRARVATGNHQADRLGVRRPGSSTSVRTILTVVHDDPRLLPRVPVFVLTALMARALSRRAVRRGDYTTWLRDESSRATNRIAG